LAKRTCGWWENCHWSLSHNHNEPNKTPHQPGGTGLLCVNNIVHQASKPGDNPLGLGRWCWIRICGPKGFSLWVILMYCPCFSTGPLMTYQQQVWQLTKIHRFECPRMAILLDISKEILGWQELGDHVMLLMDFNDPVMDQSVKSWAAKLGLVEAITWLHQEHPPPTFQCGSQPIDRICIAPQLLPFTAGGFLSFGDVVPSDHWAIWLDIHLLEIKSTNQAAHTKPQACRLQCKDPRVVARYNQALWEMMSSQQILQRLTDLNAQLNKPSDLRRHYWHDLNAIDHVLTEAKRGAENQCQKF